MKTVEIYTTPFCPYCVAAKRLLQSKNVDFVETDVSRDPALRQAMMQRAAAATRYRRSSSAATCRGCDDLHALDHKGGWTRCWPTDACCPGPAERRR